jgi:predicted ATPase
MSVYGWPAPECGSAYERARDIARKLESPNDLAPPLVGLWLVHLARGQFVQAEEISDELFKIARDLNDPDILLQAHHVAWPAQWMRGKLDNAVAHIDAALDLYDETRHARHRFLYMSHDPAVCALSVGSAVQWERGRPEKGMRMEIDALKLARRLQHAPTLAHGLWLVGEAQVARGDVSALIVTAQELLGLCEEHHLPQPKACALMFLGWAQAQSGEIMEGLHNLEKGLTLWKRLGVRSFLARATCLLAEAYAQGERYSDSLQQVELALAIAAEIGDERCVPRMHIHHAGLHLHLGRKVEAAEGLRRAIVVSKAQGARGWELRAAMSLARLWRDQGKVPQARELLAPVYGWFTEGFDTRDLKEAKALLEQLA